MSTTDTLPEYAPDEEEILRVIRLRLSILRPLVVEYERLSRADASLDKALAKLTR